MVFPTPPIPTIGKTGIAGVLDSLLTWFDADVLVDALTALLALLRFEQALPLL